MIWLVLDLDRGLPTKCQSLIDIHFPEGGITHQGQKDHHPSTVKTDLELLESPGAIAVEPLDTWLETAILITDLDQRSHEGETQCTGKSRVKEDMQHTTRHNLGVVWLQW